MLAFFFCSALLLQGCKKCWECSYNGIPVLVDGNESKVCDKQQKEAIENQVYTDINGNAIGHPKCK